MQNKMFQKKKKKVEGMWGEKWLSCAYFAHFYLFIFKFFSPFSLLAGVVLQIARLRICSITLECVAWMCVWAISFPFFLPLAPFLSHSVVSEPAHVWKSVLGQVYNWRYTAYECTLGSCMCLASWVATGDHTSSHRFTTCKKAIHGTRCL